MKYTIELTEEEIRMIRTALEFEADRRAELNSKKAGMFDELANRFGEEVIKINKSKKTFQIIGRKYDDDECVEERQFPIKKFFTVTDAKKWVLINYPEYYMGCSIKQIDDVTSPDFTCVAIPVYFESVYNTKDKEYILKQILADFDRK